MTTNNELPEGASALIALARIAHRDGNRKLEQSAAGQAGPQLRNCSSVYMRGIRRPGFARNEGQ